jgi:hypothetical protein
MMFGVFLPLPTKRMLRLIVIMSFWVHGCSESSPGNPADGGGERADSTASREGTLKGDSDGTLPSACSGVFRIEDLQGNLVSEKGKKDDLFDPEKLHTFRLKITQGDWETLQKNPLSEDYVPATLEFANKRYLGAAVRYKGDWTTLKTCFDEQGKQICPKLSIMVRFNKYDRCGRFYGLRRLVFNSSIRDSTLMRERLAYNFLRDLGLKASRASHAKLVINDGPALLYVLVEAVDKEYLEDRFSNAEGNLYKQVWPSYEDSEPYLEALRTNEENNPDFSRIIQFAKTLKNIKPQSAAQELAPFLDLASLARDVAAQELIGGEYDGPILFICWDDYCANNNYYWYEEPQNKFALLPWDLDQTFQKLPKHLTPSWWFVLPASCEPVLPCVFYEKTPCPDPDDPGDQKIKPPQCEALLRYPSSFTLMHIWIY